MSALESENVNLWPSAQHANAYLESADTIPHRGEGEATLLEFLPKQVSRFLDIGSGDGRLLRLVKSMHPASECVALDFSPTMLQILRNNFGNQPEIIIIEHNLDQPLPALGAFDAVVSSFAIHHVTHQRKRTLYAEIYDLLQAGAVFLNLEHVASPSASLHDSFLHAIGYTAETEDPSNKLLDFEIQLEWLREIGFIDVDCHWKWRELALLAGRKPTHLQL
jgi:tRNA (cmo5U34)-methyltransferase